MMSSSSSLSSKGLGEDLSWLESGGEDVLGLLSRNPLSGEKLDVGDLYGLPEWSKEAESAVAVDPARNYLLGRRINGCCGKTGGSGDPDNLGRLYSSMNVRPQDVGYRSGENLSAPINKITSIIVPDTRLFESKDDIEDRKRAGALLPVNIFDTLPMAESMNAISMGADTIRAAMLQNNQIQELGKLCVKLRDESTNDNEKAMYTRGLKTLQMAKMTNVSVFKKAFATISRVPTVNPLALHRVAVTNRIQKDISDYLEQCNVAKQKWKKEVLATGMAAVAEQIWVSLNMTEEGFVLEPVTEVTRSVMYNALADMAIRPETIDVVSMLFKAVKAPANKDLLQATGNFGEALFAIGSVVSEANDARGGANTLDSYYVPSSAEDLARRGCLLPQDQPVARARDGFVSGTPRRLEAYRNLAERDALEVESN